MPDKIYLRQMQALPLIAKVHMSQQRIREWYDHFQGNVFISFSGGKDSTVLTHVVHEYYPDVPLVFVNTGLEYPEIQAFAKKMGAEFIRPKMQFSEVISTYGYPIISKENAEAIHYARKIRVGGVQRYSTTGKHSWVAESVSRPYRMEKSNAHRQTSYGRENYSWGGMTDTHRKRSNLMGIRNQYEHERQIGINGEDKPLPG